MPPDPPVPTTATVIDKLGRVVEERKFPSYEKALAFAEDEFARGGRSVELRRETGPAAELGEPITLLGRKDYL